MLMRTESLNASFQKLGVTRLVIESTWRWKTLVVVGGVNEKIAATIGITESTVKLHRGQVMRKMLLKSFQELVRMANKLGIPHTKS